MPVVYRSNLFRALAAKLRANRSLVIETIVREAGKVIGETTTETDRDIFTTETAADEAKRIDGAVIPLNLPSSKGRFGIVRRFPTGPIAGISPCNFPLDLTLHKVASALAPGGPIMLKPPSLAPLTMLLIARFADEIRGPKDILSVLPMDRETGDARVDDPRFKLLSFTGSPDIGRHRPARNSSYWDWEQCRSSDRRRFGDRLCDLSDSDGSVFICWPSLRLSLASLRPRGEIRGSEGETGRNSDLLANR